MALRRHLHLALLARQIGGGLHRGEAQRRTGVLVIDAEQAARRGARAARQRHVGDEVIVGAELLLLLGGCLASGPVLRPAAPDRVALADEHLRGVAGGDVMRAVGAAAEFFELERRRTVAAGGRCRARGAAAEQPERAARADALQSGPARQPCLDDLGNRRSHREADDKTNGVGACALTPFVRVTGAGNESRTHPSTLERLRSTKRKRTSLTSSNSFISYAVL